MSHALLQKGRHNLLPIQKGHNVQKGRLEVPFSTVHRSLVCCRVDAFGLPVECLLQGAGGGVLGPPHPPDLHLGLRGLVDLQLLVPHGRCCHLHAPEWHAQLMCLTHLERTATLAWWGPTAALQFSPQPHARHPRRLHAPLWPTRLMVDAWRAAGD